MKLTIACLIAFVACVSCAPSDLPPLTDEEALEYISSYFEELNSKTPSDIRQELVINNLNSIDKQCILDQYKKYNFVDQIYHAKNARVKNAEMAQAIGIIFTANCYKNLDVFLEFVFENYMTFHILYKAFGDAPEFQKYVDYIHCANEYAYNHKIIDSEVYKLNTTVVNTEACDEIKDVARTQIQTAVRGFTRGIHATGSDKQCFKKFFTDVENFFIRSVLLVQVDLTDEQHVQERTNFIKNFHNYYDEGVHCAVAFANDVHE